MRKIILVMLMLQAIVSQAQLTGITSIGGQQMRYKGKIVAVKPEGYNEWVIKDSLLAFKTLLWAYESSTRENSLDYRKFEAAKFVLDEIDEKGNVKNKTKYHRAIADYYRQMELIRQYIASGAYWESLPTP